MIHVVYALACVVIPCLIYQLVNIKLQPGKQSYLAKHLFWVYVFLLYLFMVFEVTGIGSIWEIGLYGDIIRLEEINLIPFSSEGGLTYVLNVIMFMPLGFLLPFLWKFHRRFSAVLLTGAGFSFFIEFGQLFNRRETDIDDLLMNTLGAVLGYILWKIFGRLFGRLVKKTEAQDVVLGKMEPVIYPILAAAGMFFLFNWRLPFRFV